MPDFSGQFRVSDSWLTTGSSDQAMACLAQIFAATPPQSGQPLETEVGSRLAMRSLGFLTPPSKVPLRVIIEAVEHDQGTRVMVQAVSNQGWYAMSSSRLTDRVYDRAFKELLAALRQAAPPA